MVKLILPIVPKAVNSVANHVTASKTLFFQQNFSKLPPDWLRKKFRNLEKF